MQHQITARLPDKVLHRPQVHVRVEDHVLAEQFNALFRQRGTTDASVLLGAICTTMAITTVLVVVVVMVVMVISTGGAVRVRRRPTNGASVGLGGGSSSSSTAFGRLLPRRRG